MSIIYLYVKQHSITGLKYFGKTISKNPFKYPGSGLVWTRHIKKHGIEHIKTIEIWGFDNQELCTEFALKFSASNNIIEAKEWANLVAENGIGGVPGLKHSLESLKKISLSTKNRLKNGHAVSTKQKISETMSNKQFGESQIEGILKNLNSIDAVSKRINTQKLNNSGIFNRDNRRLGLINSKTPESIFKKRQTMLSNNHQQGCKNSQYGTKWITNEIINAKIDSKSTLPVGWRYGRI
jgi:hypothetical protein